MKEENSTKNAKLATSEFGIQGDCNKPNASIKAETSNEVPDASIKAETSNDRPDIIVKSEIIEYNFTKKRLIVFAVSLAMLTAMLVISLCFIPNWLYKDGARGGIKKAGTITGIIAIYILLAITAAVLFISKQRHNKSKTVFFTTKNITRTAVFSSLSIVLYYFVKFPVPAIFPSFLDFQFSDLPALLSGYMMGPISGAIVIIIKFLVKLPSTSTACVGEVIDLILGLSFVIPASMIYRRRHNIKWAVISLVIGSLICVTMAALANRFIAVPAYLKLMFNGEWGVLLNSMNAIFGGKVTQDNFYLYYIFLSVIPFNLLRCLITSVLTFLSYKSLKRLFDRIAK